MAFWNAPVADSEHAEHACDSALAIRRELNRLNAELEAEAKADGRTFQPLQASVGINTGECVVGNMGSEERLAYTAMGDAVNLASRLGGQCKTYQVDIILGQATRQVTPAWAAIELDLIAVKGKQEATRIYALLGPPEQAVSQEFLVHVQRHDQMLSYYRGRDWDGARALLTICRSYREELSGLYDLYAERIAYFEANPPGLEWDGVFVAETK
jgi:adenylate cyclase